MRLTDLEAILIKFDSTQQTYVTKEGDPTSQVTGPRQFITRNKVTFDGAQGIQFLCPLHFKQRADGVKGTHMIEITFDHVGVPDNFGGQRNGSPKRYTVIPTSSGIDDLSIAQPIISPCCEWVGKIQNGDAS